MDLARTSTQATSVLAAVVWNEGQYAALAQWSNRTGFLVRAADSEHEKLVNTGTAGWAPRRTPPINLPSARISVVEIGPGYYAISPMERFDAAQHPWGWQTAAFDDSAWSAVENGPAAAAARDSSDSPSRWMLVPRPIP